MKCIKNLVTKFTRFFLNEDCFLKNIISNKSYLVVSLPFKIMIALPMPYLNGSTAHALIGLRLFIMVYLMVVHNKGLITFLVKCFKLKAFEKNRLRGFIFLF